MSKKQKVVLFEKGKLPRIYTNPNIEELKKRGDVAVNPKLPVGISPDNWGFKSGKIIVLDTPFIPEVKKRPVIRKSIEKQPKLDKFKLCVILGGIALAVSNIYFNLDQIITLIERIR